MAHKDQIDQDALAAEWGLALDSDAAAMLAAAPSPKRQALMSTPGSSSI